MRVPISNMRSKASPKLTTTSSSSRPGSSLVALTSTQRENNGGGDDGGQQLQPPPLTWTAASKLFGVGATVGPVVDSLHNQCLLEYNVLPITVDPYSAAVATATATGNAGTISGNSIQYDHHLFCSSWTVLPLLGIAYVVLGGILPRVVRSVVVGRRSGPTSQQAAVPPSTPEEKGQMQDEPQLPALRSRALLAVASTALIIKLSALLQTSGALEEPVPIIALSLAALTQWACLDGTKTALLAAAITSVGGPLSELPFVGHKVWEYLPSAADYFPLRDLNPSSAFLGSILQSVLVGGAFDTDYHDLALSSITGPCYFAVAMDAIALGRWFDYESGQNGDSSAVSTIDSTRRVPTKVR